jgi:hypothetical protein
VKGPETKAYSMLDYDINVAYARTLLKILEFSFILISSFPKSNVSIFLLVSLKFLNRQQSISCDNFLSYPIAVLFAIK